MLKYFFNIKYQDHYYSIFLFKNIIGECSLTIYETFSPIMSDNPSFLIKALNTPVNFWCC